MNDIDVQVGAVVVAVLGAVRKQFPAIDGVWVLVVASVLGAALGWLLGQDSDPRKAIIRGVVAALTASGVLHGASYLVQKKGAP